MTELGDARAADICHIEIPAKDLAKAEAFYIEVFGWEVRPEVPSADYWFFRTGNVSGAFDANRSATDDGVCLILEVEDILATLRAIEKAGGTKIADKRELPDGAGFVAAFRDPNGVRMELWSET